MAEDVSILQEIDEALRADKAAQFWSRHSGTITAFCAMLVLGTAASAFWKSHMHEVHEAETGKLTQAALLMDDGKYAEAIAQFEPLEHEGGPMAGLAALKHAQSLISMKQEDKAVAVYNDMASGKFSGVPDVFRNYAALEADILSHNLAAASGKPAIATEGGDARAPGKTFADAFAEIDALRDRDGKNMATLLNVIVNDKEAPFSQRVRAAEMLATLKEHAKPDAAAKDATTKETAKKEDATKDDAQ